MRGVRGLRGRPGLHGLVGGAMGVRAQAMTGGKRQVVDIFLTPGAATFRAAITGWHDILLYGGGGPGGSTPGTAASGGGGGGAALKRVWLRANDDVSYTVGTAAGDSTGDSSASIPGRFSFSATHGNPGGTGYILGGLGGVGSGGDINRRGGRGCGFTNPNGDPNDNDGVGMPAEWGEGGGDAWPAAEATGAGGGAAGFREIIPTLAGCGGDSGRGRAAGIPGGGGTGLTVGQVAAPGAVAFVYAK